jgi:hypothetical protein
MPVRIIICEFPALSKSQIMMRDSLQTLRITLIKAEYSMVGRQANPTTFSPISAP